MKITHNKIGQNLNLTDSSKTNKASQTKNSDSSGVVDKKNDLLSSTTGFDSAKVDLSPRAQDIQKAKDIAMSTPDVDLAKIEKFQKLIDNGDYKIDSKAIADRMVNEHLFESGSTSND